MGQMTYELYLKDPTFLQALFEVLAGLKTIPEMSQVLEIPEENLREFLKWFEQQSNTTATPTESHGSQVDHMRLQPGEFLELVRLYFRYLFTDYGFTIMTDSEYAAWLDSQVVTQSADTRVRFDLESHGEYVAITLNPLPDGSSMDLMEIVEWRTRSRRRLTYTLPDDASLNVLDSIKWQMNRLSEMLQEYAEPFLRGDFSGFEKLRAFRNR
jgi:hypothetical protein